MSRLRSILDARNAPIWVKLLIGLGLVVLLLLIPAVLLIRGATDELATTFNESTVSNLGAAQSATISNSIVQARGTLDTFVLNGENERLLQGLLLSGVNTSEVILPRTEPAQIETLFNATLLNPATGLYDSVRVLDRNGFVVATAATNNIAGLASGTEAGQATFEAARAGAAEGRAQTLTVVSLPGNSGALEYAIALLWRDGRPLGYVVGRMSNTRVIYTGLRFPTDLPRDTGFSYLASGAGDMLTYPDARLRAESVSDVALAQAAFTGDVGVTPLTTADDTVYYVYTTTVPGAPLALATHLNSTYGASQFASLLETRRLIIFALSAVLALVGVALLTQLIASPINRLRQSMARFATGDLSTPVPDTGRGDEIGALARETAVTREKFSLLVADLENRIIARNRDFAATQEIARYAASQVNLQTLMERVVDLVAASFPAIYHAQIFLIDADREYALLRASTGEAGRLLLRRGHRLAVGSQSVIGQVTDTGELVVARDTAASPVHRRNEFLPDTRAELAIPLKIGAVIIGALDVQSREADVFTPDLVAALQTMADQVSITIQNARLYEEASRRSADVDESNKRATLNAWQNFLRDQRAQRFTQSAGQKDADAGQFAPLRQQALETGQPALGEPTERDTLPVAVPIVLRGQTLGTVEWELPAQSFGEDRLSLAQELASRLAISLENARLFQESRRAAERERLVNSISASITAQTNVDLILQTAVREVGQALHAPQVAIRLRDDLTGVEPKPNGSAPNGANGVPAQLSGVAQDA
ncbi:MAG TPA: GAF domain-containing protein [Candidatus Limnocylindrales bacterium]|nr:GAF domain-containing protein [Candidatus Limnocylindrales bacterium]